MKFMNSEVNASGWVTYACLNRLSVGELHKHRSVLHEIIGVLDHVAGPRMDGSAQPAIVLVKYVHEVMKQGGFLLLSDLFYHVIRCR